ncbi:MAG: DUF465 domain-containing protein [Nitrospiria bacterium]
MGENNQVIELLREKNRRFRILEEKHHALETSLQCLNRRKILTPQEELQKRTFQKEKLAAKDTMSDIIRHYRATGRTDLG